MSLNLLNPFTKFGGGGGARYFELLDRDSGTLPDVSSFSAMPYLQVLTDMIPASRANYSLVENNTTSAAYAIRNSDDGATDYTATGQTNGVSMNDSGNSQMFGVGNWSNIGSQDKIWAGFGVNQSPDGSTSGGIPERREGTGKYVDSNQITSIKAIENAGGSFNSASEIVVLGYDPAASSGSSAWESLAEVDHSGSATDVIDSGTISAKKYMWLEFTGVSDGTGNIDCSLTINNITTSTYAYRICENNGAERTSASTTQAACQYSGNDSETFLSAYILNKSGTPKLFITHQQNRQTAGAGTAPYWNQGVSKSTTTAAITSIQVQNNGGGSYAAGSKLRIWGFD